jgi:hypothetical protein
MRRILILSVPLVDAGIDPTMGRPVISRIGHVDVYHSSIGKPSISDLRKLLEDFPLNYVSINVSIGELRSWVLKECGDSTTVSSCYTSLMDYVYLSSESMFKGRGVPEDPGPICTILKRSDIRDRINRSIRILATEREFHIPSNLQEQHYPLGFLPQLCDITDDKDLRMAVFFQRIYKHAAMYRSTPTMTTVYPPMGSIPRLRPEVEQIVSEYRFDRVFQEMDGRIDRTKYHEWRESKTFDLINKYFEWGTTELTLRDKWNTQEDWSASDLGKFLALSLLEQAPLGVRFSQGMCTMLLQSGDAWTEDDLKRESVDLHNKYKSFRDAVIDREGIRYFVSLFDPSKPLIPNGEVTPVTFDNLGTWSTMALAEIRYGQYAAVAEPIHMGFDDFLPPNVFNDNIIAPEELCDLFDGQNGVSTREFIERLIFPEFVVSEWVGEILERKGEDFINDLLVKARAFPAGPFAPLIQIIESDVVLIDPVYMTIGLPSRVESARELEAILDEARVVAHESERRLPQYEYMHDEIQAPNPVPRSMFADDPFDHGPGLRSLYEMVERDPRTANAGYRVLSSALSKFTTASERAFESLNGVLLSTDIRRCFSSGTELGESCLKLMFNFSILMTELASRNTKRGEDPVFGGRSEAISWFWKSGPAQKKIAKFAVISSSIRDHFSPVRSVPNPRLYVLIERYSLANLPYVTSGDFYLRLSVAGDRITRHILTHPKDRIMWEIRTGDPISETLGRIAAVDPLHLLNKIHIPYRGVGRRVVWGARAYIEWLSDLYTQVFTNGFLFEPPTQSEKQLVRMNPSRSNDPTFRSHYRAVGRLLALSLVDQVPTGFNLPIALVKLILDGRTDERRENIWKPEEDLKLTDTDVYDRYNEISSAAITSDVSHAFISLTGQPIAGHSPTERLNRINIESWRRLVVVDYIYLQHKIGYDAIVGGFYDLLPEKIFDSVFTTDELRDLFRGKDSSIDELLDDSCDLVADLFTDAFSGKRKDIYFVLTGLNASPLIWNKQKYACAETDGPLTFNAVKHWIKYPRDLKTLFPARFEGIGIGKGASEVWDKLTEISRLFFTYSSPRVGTGIPDKLVTLAGNRDAHSFAVIGRVFLTDIGTLEEFGGLELISRVLVGEGAEQALMTIMFLLGELPPILSVRNAEPINPFIFEFVQREICPKLVSEKFLVTLTERTTRRIQYRENVGGVYREQFGAARTDYPLARLPTVCRMPRNLQVRRTVVDDRIGRSLYTSGSHERYDLHIPYDFDVTAVLDEIARISSERYAKRIQVVYPQNESEGVGAGAYRNWMSRMFERLIPLYFARDQKGIHRVDRGLDFVTHIPRLRAIGRLLASTILDSVPTGQPLNYGLYRFLMNGPDYVWTSEDLKSDDPLAFKSWTDTVEAYRNGMDLDMSYVSLEGEEVWESDRELNSGNIEEWATAALNHHMFGRYMAAYEAIRIGFSETLGSEPSLIFEGAMEVEDLQSTIEGEYDVSTDQIMQNMVFRGFSGDEEDRLRMWLQQLLHEGGNEFRVNFLTFVTGWKSLPIGGFHTGRSITVSRIGDEWITHLPKSYTCHLQMNLPAYPTIAILKEKLELAVGETQLLLE